VLHDISMKELLANDEPTTHVASEQADCCRRDLVLCDGGEHDRRAASCGSLLGFY
jgi:hypothetical protein